MYVAALSARVYKIKQVDHFGLYTRLYEWAKWLAITDLFLSSNTKEPKPTHPIPLHPTRPLEVGSIII